MRVTSAGNGWLVLFETLQTQLAVTSPVRTAVLVDASGKIARRYSAAEGWVLLDAVAHPSGDVSLLGIRLDPAAQYPLRAMISRVGAGGTVEHELVRLEPSNGPEDPPAVLTSLDRARIVAFGEDLFAVVRWANNSVQACRISFDGRALRQEWVAWVEPAALLYSTGIIGGGFDNFHQGDSPFFVYADVDGRGNLYCAVASAEGLPARHDAFFGENLSAQTDPANFEFGTAIVTRLARDGGRTFSALTGIPGKEKRLLNMRVADDAVVLVGRVRTGRDPGSWDAWILSLRQDGSIVERTVDVQNGDMFWDVAPLPNRRLLAVGSTGYTQNPSGLSVSDARDPLAVVLDPDGNVERRLALPAGPRGNEAMSVAVSVSGAVAISGVQNAPGTHAEVFSDAFLAVRPLQDL